VAVFRLARGWTTDDAAAEDVLQETFISAFAALPAFRGESSLRSWLLAIARNAAHHHRVRAERFTTRSDEDLGTLAVEAGWASSNPEKMFERVQERQQLESALASLDIEEREILLLRDVEGLSGEETASILSLSLPAMKSRLHRARLRLVAQLRKGERHGPPRT
jgi:RNA polymerase sigma-70 factor (ECF subfamily)